MLHDEVWLDYTAETHRVVLLHAQACMRKVTHQCSCLHCIFLSETLPSPLTTKSQRTTNRRCIRNSTTCRFTGGQNLFAVLSMVLAPYSSEAKMDLRGSGRELKGVQSATLSSHKLRSLGPNPHTGHCCQAKEKERGALHPLSNLKSDGCARVCEP